MIRRPPRSTLSSSSAASDVYKRQVMSFFAPSIGGANSDGIAGVVWFKPSGGVVAIAGPPNGEASGPIAGSFGSASGVAAMLALDSGAASSTAASVSPVSEAGASAVLVVALSRSSTLPTIWADPTTMAMTVSYTHLRAHETPEHLVCR